jgi:hypothetical protein
MSEARCTPGSTASGRNNQGAGRSVKRLRKTNAIVKTREYWGHSDHQKCIKGQKQTFLYNFVPFADLKADSRHPDFITPGLGLA